MEDNEEKGGRFDRKRLWNRRIPAWLAVCLPVLIFYVTLFRQAVDLPEMDDYDAILGFLNTFVRLGTTRARLEFFLASQHVQYKLWFEHALVLAQWKLTGHVNFFVLQQIGNLFVLLTVLVLWRMFRPQAKHFSDRLSWFAPVVLIVFAPRYSETLNWAMGSLQNITVLFFAMLTIDLLTRPCRTNFVAASLSLVLAIACSGNGFILAVVGALALLQQRAWVRTGLWTALTACMAGMYAFRYTLNHVPPPAGAHHPLLVLCLFPFAFLGAAGSRLWLALPLSAAMLWVAFLLMRNRWRMLSSSTFFACVFLALTGVGVGLTRHNFGLHAALSSRYVLYSQMLLALFYMAALQLGFDRKPTGERRRLFRGATLFVAVGYFAWTSAAAARSMSLRSALIRQHYRARSANPGRVPLIPDEEQGMHSAGMQEFSRRAEATLLESERLGVYTPPKTLP